MLFYSELDFLQTDLPGSYTGLEYSLDHQPPPLLMNKQPRIGDISGENNNIAMVDYMFNNPSQQQLPSSFGGSSTSLDKLNFAEVMQFADFGPKLALNQTKTTDEENGMDPVYFLKFPVLNDRSQHQNLINTPLTGYNGNEFDGLNVGRNVTTSLVEEEEEEPRVSENNSMQHGFLNGASLQKNSEVKKRKRPRSVKTSEEVESQRMTHIAVERNRRKQMNEHLRVLRSLMPGSYVQRGDQASIIGGAIEFVRELEQLLQCLESQKRRRLYGNGEAPRPMDDPNSLPIQQPQPPFFPPMPSPTDQIKFGEYDTGLLEETAENKSCLADVEVKVVGFDALIKILSQRRPGQLIKTIAALEDLQFNILHTNITTIEQTVLYSFNVKFVLISYFVCSAVAEDADRSIELKNGALIGGRKIGVKACISSSFLKRTQSKG
ncbi:Transcription factor fama [Thalictrum thalictroides]|uniref:Transcription factor fama n=1 Tax=Thalictrum thalictroides TaxID=46969 RepID=A0A7J6VQX9_THATH|nr:Transcription factor fama [Thalictrum thalictroides]